MLLHRNHENLDRSLDKNVYFRFRLLFTRTIISSPQTNKHDSHSPYPNGHWKPHDALRYHLGINSDTSLDLPVGK